MRFNLVTKILTLELQVIFKGSEVAEREGVYYAISDHDHPATKLMQSPYKISRGMAAQIGLSIRKVILTVPALKVPTTILNFH